MAVNDKIRNITILCSLDSHSICSSRNDDIVCECECHFGKATRHASEDSSFEDRLAYLSYELWVSAHYFSSLSWTQIRATVLKFYKKYQCPNPVDAEVDEVTRAIQTIVKHDDWSLREWENLYAARKTGQPTLF